MSTEDYEEFLSRRLHSDGHGFEDREMPRFLFEFQRHLVQWSLAKGRSAIFADCGLGKTPMELVWAERVAKRLGKPVLIVTPLAVSFQHVQEAAKFNLECQRSVDGGVPTPVVVTNYERLRHFKAENFSGLVCDESSILKNFDGVRRAEITEFMRTLPCRLLATATAAPNDYIELGTSSESLGEMGHMDMLGRFFKNDQNSLNANRLWDGAKWRFKRHAESAFWRWVCSWSRSLRKPSDLGFSNDGFELPDLVESEHVIQTRSHRNGMLFAIPAVSLREQREERRLTVRERCALAAELASGTEQVAVWCHLNEEGDLLAREIEGAVQVSGKDDDDEKEEKLAAFAAGQIRVLVTKPKIGAWGLNLQRCARIVTFPSHSYEQYYQLVRRCWRYGQTRPVHVHIVASEGERAVLANLKRKADQADRMFSALVQHMTDALMVKIESAFHRETEAPRWLLQNRS